MNTVEFLFTLTTVLTASGLITWARILVESKPIKNKKILDNNK